MLVHIEMCKLVEAELNATAHTEILTPYAGGFPPGPAQKPVKCNMIDEFRKNDKACLKF